MTLFLNDLINECVAQGFFGFESYGDQLVTLTVPNKEHPDQILPVMVEFQDETCSASAVVVEIPEEGYLPAVRLCNQMNAGTRWYKHFLQETPDGTFQVCVVADWVARELSAAKAFEVLMAFCQHVYQVEHTLMQEE